MAKRIGVLTAGSDSPGLNAAIRAIGKSGRDSLGMEVTGFRDGFRGLVYDQFLPFQGNNLSGILPAGGTILGTSRDTPPRIWEENLCIDRTDDAVATYKKHKLDALICLGGRETQEAGLHLSRAGLNIITLPKAIDGDIAGTEATIGFDTAMSIATEAMDRIHTTALSSHRILIVEIMGRYAGWLTLGSGLAGGADVILIPEIPYDIQKINEAVQGRNQAGRRFSIVAVSEGAISQENAAFFEATREANERLRTGAERDRVAQQLAEIQGRHKDNVGLLADRLEKFTGLETRTTILGYLLRGGAPSATDRVLATQMGTYCMSLIEEGRFGVMVTLQSGQTTAVDLEEVAGKHRPVPADHPWIASAKEVGASMGD